MKPSQAQCRKCGRDFASPKSAYRHWLFKHSFRALGQGERAILDDLQRAKEAEERPKHDDEESA